jgi:hypothetical protein
LKAGAVESQAKAVAFKPSWARTSLLVPEDNHCFVWQKQVLEVKLCFAYAEK